MQKIAEYPRHKNKEKKREEKEFEEREKKDKEGVNKVAREKEVVSVGN